MRPQKVSVDVWKMVVSSCYYLGLAFLVWVFLKLVNACIYLPRYLCAQEKKLEEAKLKATAEEELKDECKKDL